jgi:signal transduction histidine kinase
MPLVQDRQVSGSLVIVDDITERRGREARMRRMENLASLTTLAAGVAHEIKNPLGAISLHVQLIQKTMNAHKMLNTDSEDCAVCEKYLKVVNEELDRLNNIVVDFLFAVRPMNAKLRKGDINALIAELADFVSLELKGAHIECSLSLAEKLPALSFDEKLMKQALLNLIKNAEAAMSGGGKLTIATEALEGEARIIIADTGAGIPEENYAKIFEPYFTTRKEGTGLGLTMVFKIIKEHQGDISVESKEGEGSVFVITLPITQTDQRLISYEAGNPCRGPLGSNNFVSKGGGQ